MTRDDQILLLLNNITKLLQDRSDLLPRVEYEKKHEELQKRTEEIDLRLIKQEERGRVMGEEIEDLKNELKDTRRAIIDNQNAYYKRMIAVQGSILFLILSVAIGLFIKLFFP